MKNTLWQRLVAGIHQLRHCADWERFVGPDWPKRIMDIEVTDRFFAKQGRSIGRCRWHAAGRELAVYLKRHYRLPWWRHLLATLWPRHSWSPGLQEWDNLGWARTAGFPVPRAVAAGQFIGPWCQLQSFLAVEELAGMLPLHQAIPLAQQQLSPGDFRRWKAGLTREMARLTRDLHRQQRFHKDLYLCHFYLAETDIAAAGFEDWRGRVYVIDLHRLGHHPWTWLFWQVKDLAQLLYSSEVAGVGLRDRLRFWRAYLGRGRSSGWLRRLVMWKCQSYQRHNHRL